MAGGVRLAMPFVAMLALVAGLAGCGGGSRAVATSSATDSEYVKQADAICAEGRLRALRYRPSLGEAKTRGRIAGQIEAVVLPAMQSVVDRLYALGAPATRKAQAEEFLAVFQGAVDDAKELKSPTFERLESIFAEQGKIAVKAGLEACAYG